MQAHVWADSSLQHFVKGASGMQVEVSWSSACPGNKGQNESLTCFSCPQWLPLQSMSSHWLQRRIHTLTLKWVCVNPPSPFLGGRTSSSHRDWVLGGLWRRPWRIPWLNFYSHSSERKWWKPCFCINSVCVVLGSFQSRPPLHFKWHQREAVALMDYMWEG